MQHQVEATGSAVGDDQQAAFASFYERQGGQVLRALALSLGDQELAREATQEGMVRAWHAWDRISRYDNPAGWVYRVGLNWGRSRLRRLSRELLGQDGERTGRDDEPDPIDPVLVAALAELSHRHRAVAVLRLYLDWSVEEVAAALNIPQGTVRSRQHTALQRLRERWEMRP